MGDVPVPLLYEVQSIFCFQSLCILKVGALLLSSEYEFMVDTIVWDSFPRQSKHYMCLFPSLIPPFFLIVYMRIPFPL